MTGFGMMLKDYLEFHKISQSDFAQSLNITQKHMNEILNENASMSLDLMLAISLITDIDINLITFVETKKRIGNELLEKYGTEREINQFLNQYYIKEMNKMGWIKLRDVESPIQKAMDLLQFLKIKNFDMLEHYQNEKLLYKKSEDADKTKLLLWIRHCDSLIEEQVVKEYNRQSFIKLIEELKEEQNKKFNVVNIQKILNQYGIYFVVEDALKGTKVRGCMQVRINHPVIYLTKLYKDKASFYFSLYHELGHVKRDYNEAKSKIIVLDLEKEEKADSFALETMIPSKIWEKIIKSDFSSLKDISKSNHIPMCFIVTRLAKEGYISYSDELYNNYKESIE